MFKNGERVDLQESGPRFTLKLKWLQKGTFDVKNGDYEWVMKVSDCCFIPRITFLLAHNNKKLWEGALKTEPRRVIKPYGKT